MKFKVALLTIAITFLQISAQDIELKRGQLWGRVTFSPQFEKGFSAIISSSMRDNFSISKEVNGVEKPIDEQGNWLNELFLGAGWKHKVGKRSVFSTQLIYRPQFWYSDNVGGNSYLRHTLMSNNNLRQKLKPITLHHRVALWGLFNKEQGDINLDNELILRYMFGPELNLGKKVTLFIKAEPFLKLTADDTDTDGTELFNKLYTWNGMNFKPTKGLKLSAQYINMQIFPSESKHVTDHTVYLHVAFLPKWNK